MSPDKKVLRILDANFNRSREGLRVCEEIFRFFLNEPALMKRLKKARHEITGLLKSLPVAAGALLDARNTEGDEGRTAPEVTGGRQSLLDLFSANIERTKESLRVLEEFSKFLNNRVSADFKKVRFEVYAIEKRALPKLEALRDYRAGVSGKKDTRRHGVRSHSRRSRRRAAAR